MPVVGPVGSVTQQVEMTVPLAFSWGSMDEKVAAGIAVYSTAAALSRTTCSKAAFDCCGEPSLVRILVVQPAMAAACLTMFPSCRHSGTAPQGMKSMSLFLGIVPVTLVMSVIWVGRCSY